MPDLVLAEAMVARAARVLDPHLPDSRYSQEGVRELAEDIVRAAFDGVPMVNYGIGLALRSFDLVICVVNDGVNSRGGVYRAAAEQGSFDALTHQMNLSWSENPTHRLTSVHVTSIDAATSGVDRA